MTDASDFVLCIVKFIYGDEALGSIGEFVTYPVNFMSPAAMFSVTGAQELERLLAVIRGGLRLAGIADVRPEIRSVMTPMEGMAIVSLCNWRLGPSGDAMGAHRSTYVVRQEEEAWRLVALSVDHDDKDELQHRMEHILAQHGILKPKPTLAGDMP
ncbi:MAG: hypothetical protein AAFN27_17985 [Pseudomonadota bacterium]